MTFTSGEAQVAFQQLMLTMLDAIAQFERNLLLERQCEGIAIAREKGKYKGRQSRFSQENIRKIKNKFALAGVNKSALAP